MPYLTAAVRDSRDKAFAADVLVAPSPSVIELLLEPAGLRQVLAAESDDIDHVRGSGAASGIDPALAQARFAREATA
jgi:hypothetical protein